MLEEDESYLLWRKQAIELQSDPGTHRLELPVSSTTLKVWGGVPMLISEKSDPYGLAVSKRVRGEGRLLTLSVQEVVHEDVMAALGLNGGILER